MAFVVIGTVLAHQWQLYDCASTQSLCGISKAVSETLLLTSQACTCAPPHLHRLSSAFTHVLPIHFKSTAGRGRYGGQAGGSNLQGLAQGQAAMLAVLAGKQHFFLEVSRSLSVCACALHRTDT